MHKFDARSWRIIKEFWGIYPIKNIDYRIFYFGATSIFSLYLINSYKELKSPRIKSGSIYALRKALAAGYKSKLFYSRLPGLLVSQCPCCKIGQFFWFEKEHHNNTSGHRFAVESGKYDKMILEKYKEDPELFTWLEYCGFKMKLRGRKRRLVSKHRIIHL